MDSTAEAFEARWATLCNKLSEAGVDVRRDSRLCRDYVNGTSQFSVSQIVDRLCMMKYLHEHTDYVTILNEIALNDSDRETARTVARYIALERKPITDKWPWKQTS